MNRLVQTLKRVYTTAEVFEARRARRLKKSKRVAKAKQIHPKKPSLKRLKKNAWKAFADYIKARDKYTCYTCHAKATGSGLHAGHFVPATRTGTWLDERNVHAQCYRCNIWLRGNSGDYAVRLIQDHGDGIIEELTKLSHIPKVWDVETLERLETIYQDKLRCLKLAQNGLEFGELLDKQVYVLSSKNTPPK